MCGQPNVKIGAVTRASIHILHGRCCKIQQITFTTPMDPHINISTCKYAKGKVFQHTFCLVYISTPLCGSDNMWTS